MLVKFIFLSIFATFSVTSAQQILFDSQKDTMIDRLHDVRPTIEELMGIGGTAGVSIGVAIQGETAFTANFGYQDVDKKIKATSSTVYVLGSLTKAFVAAIAAKYVNQGVLDWNAPISQYLPDFMSLHKPSLAEELTLVDLLSHRTDLIRKDLLWLGADGDVLIKKDHLISVCNDLQPVASLRSKWLYNNWMYALAGEVIEGVTGKAFTELLEEVITKPLELHSTGSKVENMPSGLLAKPYMTGDDKKLYPLESVGLDSGSVMEAAGGIRSNIRDMLKWTSSLLENAEVHSAKRNAGEQANILHDISSILSGRIVMSSSPAFDELYAMGWAKVTIPATFGKIGFNPTLTSMPIVGSESPSEVVFYHNGALPGFNNAMFLAPQKNLSIVVLTNSLGQGDVADWIGQTVLQACLNTQPSVDYIGLAKDAAQKWQNRYPEMQAQLASRRINGTIEPNRKDFIGKYLHTSGALEIHVSLTTSSTLQFDLNGLPSQIHELQHYNYDTYTFFPSRSDRSRRGLVLYTADSWVSHFSRHDDGHVSSMVWHLDQDQPAGERFVKQDGS